LIQTDLGLEFICQYVINAEIKTNHRAAVARERDALGSEMSAPGSPLTHYRE